jgi:hypothetical protein
MRILTVRTINDEQKQDSSYLEDVANFIKLNYNCPDSEKNGSGPGSCGGNTPGKKSFDVSKPIDHDSYELIKNSQTEDSKNLTKEEVRAIKSEYTLVSAYINSALANGKIYQELSEGMKEKTKHNAELVVSGINKFKIPENVVVWRGVKSDIENSMSEEQKQPGTIFDNNTIISTSFKSPEKALGYSKHTYTTGKPLLLEISLPKGSPALLTDTLVDKRGTYEHSSESEIIVAPGKIKVLDYEETDTIRKLRWEYIPETQKQNSSYLSDAFETIKLNYKCKTGTVDDSNKCEPDSDSESSSSNNNHIESYSRLLQSKVPEKFGNQVYLVRMGSEKENNTNIVGNVFVGNDINMLIKKALESSKESGNLIIGRCSKDAFEDDELDKISKNNFIITSEYLGQSFSPVDVVIDTGTSDTIYKRSKDELEKEKNLFDTHELQLNKIEQNTALSNYRNFGYQSVNNVLRKNYVIEGENKKSALDPTPVYSKEYIDKALKDASLISDAMEPSKENKTLSRVDGAAITATLFPVAGITEELTNYFKKTYEKSSKYPKTEDILSGNIKPPSEKTWNNYLTTKLKDLEFKDPAFLSTSKSESGIKEDLLISSDELSPYGIPSLLNIEVPKGIRLVDMQERLGIGEGRYKTEKEVLLDKNTIFKIKSVKLEPHDNGIIARIMVRAIQKLPEPIKENSTSNNILVYFENNPIRLMDTDYLSDAFEAIKLNYKCKAGTVDDSNKCDPEQDRSIELDKPAIDLSTLPEGSKLVESKDINNIKMVHFTKPENVAPIQETGFNYSRNSTHGKGVYFTNDDNLKAYGTGKIEIELLPHNQLFVNRDIHVPKVLEQISGVRYDSPELPGKMIEKG